MERGMYGHHGAIVQSRKLYRADSIIILSKLAFDCIRVEMEKSGPVIHGKRKVENGIDCI